ncbi:MAG TPA: hypothetical protein VFK14_09090 [Solirubrobacterales bacterium]|nr:hypothetical protein [Solirubrobacterales bacterium]
MKADYDSEANALLITLIEDQRSDDGESLDPDELCNVSLSQAQVISVELLYPAENLALLKSAAERFGLDAEALLAAARAALAAPDRAVTIDLSGRLAGSC